jgi:hypothetical protein
MTDHVKSWLSDVRGAEYGFFKAVVQALESFNEGDTNSLGKLLCITHGKTCKRLKVVEKDRMPYATPLKRILDHALEGVTYKFDKSKDFGVVFDRGDNGGVSPDRIEALRVLGTKTIRDKAFKDAFPAVKKTETKPREDKAVAVSAIKAAKKNGMELAKYVAMITAMWNETAVEGEEPSF